jgi:hypothetical protein
MIRWIGRELAGVWRSVRYDLARRPNPSRLPTEVLYPGYDAYRRPPRRWYAAAGLGALVASGVAAVYVVVAGSPSGGHSTSLTPAPSVTATPSTSPTGVTVGQP